MNPKAIEDVLDNMGVTLAAYQRIKRNELADLGTALSRFQLGCSALPGKGDTQVCKIENAVRKLKEKLAKHWGSD